MQVGVATAGHVHSGGKGAETAPAKTTAQPATPINTGLAEAKANPSPGGSGSGSGLNVVA